MRPFVLATAAVMLFAVAGCSESSAQPGPEISKSFQVGPFTSLEVQGSYEVVVTTGKPASVSARGTQRLVESIVAEVKDGKLIIRPETRGWRGKWDQGRTWARISVSAPALSAVSLAGSGDTTVDRIAGERFHGAVAGSGDLNLGQVTVRQIKLAVTGSGGVKASGQAEMASYSVAGSGELDAGGLTAREAAVSAAGSGSIRARVTGIANANVAGSGSIDIEGGAKCTTSRVGSGDIRCS